MKHPLCHGAWFQRRWGTVQSNGLIANAGIDKSVKTLARKESDECGELRFWQTLIDRQTESRDKPVARVPGSLPSCPPSASSVRYTLSRSA